MNNKGNALIVTILVVLVVIAVAIIAFLIGSRGGFFLSLPQDLGSEVEESRDVSGFSKVDLSGCGNIFLTQGDEESLKIEAKEKLMEYIITEVSNDTLYIKYDWRVAPHICGIFGAQGVKYHLSLKDLESVKVSGSGKVVSDGKIISENLEFTISGSGNIEMPLEVTTLSTTVSGSGNFNLWGTVDTQNIKSSGSSKYLAKDLVSKNTTINISGSGKAEVNVQQELDIKISGSGSIYYIGQPRINQSISGSGKIESIDSDQVEESNPIEEEVEEETKE